MTNLYFKTYNNYYNRTLKLDTLATLKASYVAIVNNIQFNPHDGIDTEVVVNLGEATLNGVDYCLVVGVNERGQETNSYSRWFVMDATRIREGQYRVVLHRDVKADYYDSYKTAPAFIERAVPQDIDNMLIFNREGNTYNQIKKSQTLLKDTTQLPWIVGYMTQKAESYTIDLTDSYPEIDSIESYKYAQYLNKNVYRPVTNNTEIYVNVTGKEDGTLAMWNQRLTRTVTGWAAANNTNPTTTIADIINSNHRGSNTVSFGSSNVASIRSELAALFNNYDAAIKQGINDTLGAPNDYGKIASENNKIYRARDNGKLYKITATTITDTISKLGVKINNYLYMKLDSICEQVDGWTFTANDNYGSIRYATDDYVTFASKNYEISGSFNGLILSYEEYIPTNSIVIPATRTHCKDSQYDIFMIPFGDYSGTTKADNLKLAYKLISSLSGANVLYDVQILPFAPKYTSGTLISATGLNAQMRFIDTSSSSFNIDYTLTCKTTIFDRKVQSECQFFRLSSPNWASTFEFSVAKNTEDILKFKVSYTLKPYSPYIRVCPVFSNFGLYKHHDNDAMGLVCSGEFSLSMINDAWATYELQNKNYQLSFDRNIKSLDIQQGVQRTEQVFGAIASAVGAASSGAYLGANAGGAIGGAIGGVVSGAASVVGAVADWNNQEKLRKDARSNSIDQFNYSLGNIRALPDTITRLSAYNVDNKYFFVLEEYDATQDEKDALYNQLEVQGFKLGIVDAIENYVGDSMSYVQARIAKMPALHADSHVAHVIAEEFSKGVFIYDSISN